MIGSVLSISINLEVHGDHIDAVNLRKLKKLRIKHRRQMLIYPTVTQDSRKPEKSKMEMIMKQLIGAAALALAFTGTASAYDNHSTGGYGYDNSYAVEKPNYAPKKQYGYGNGIKVQEDPNPSKLKKQLQFFNEISGDH